MKGAAAGVSRRIARDGLAILSGAQPQTAAVVLMFLTVPQFYLVPRGAIDVALTTVVTLLLLPGLLLKAWRGGNAVLRAPVVWILVATFVLRMLALLWSPDPRAGLQPIVLFAQFLGALLVAYAAVREDPGLLRGIQVAFLPWVVVEIVLVVLFRILPGLEEAFQRSIGGYFAGQNAMAALFGDNPNNVLDPAKSGGLFVNANVAGMFLGVSGLAALAMATLTGTRWARVVGVLSLVTVPITGSKSATVLTVALPAAVAGFWYLRHRATPRVRRYAPIAGIAGGVLVVSLIALLNARFLAALGEAFVGRTAIWSFGWEALQDSPLLGLGYGGWDAGFARYADEHDIWRVFPPHNILLGAWATTGLLGVVLTVLFFVLAFRLVTRRLAAADVRHQRFAIYAGAAIAWILIQGLGENTDVYGDIHLIPVTALLIAHLVAPIGQEPEHVGISHRRYRAAPAVSALGDVHPEPGSGATEFPAAVRRAGPGAADAEG